MPARVLLIIVLVTCLLQRGLAVDSTVAVFPPGSGGATGLAAALTDGLQGRLADRGVTVVERERVMAAIVEQALGSSGLIDPATAARLGKMLGADLLVVGSIRELDGHATAVLRAVRAADGAIAWAGIADGVAAEVAAQAPALADALITALTVPLPAITGERVGLLALRHEERARALIAQRAHADAAAEALLALHSTADSPTARLAFIQALAEGGFTTLAAAEARVALTAATPPAHLPRLRAWADAKPPARPAVSPPRPGDGVEERAHRAVIAELDKLATGADRELADLAACDLTDAWKQLGDVLAEQGRDRAAMAAYRESALRGWALYANGKIGRDGRGRAWTRAILPADLVPLSLLCDGGDPHRLVAAVTAALAAGGLPRDPAVAVPSASRELRLSPIDSVALPASENRARLGLVRFDLSQLPPQARVVGAQLTADRCCRVRQAWVGTEADPNYARKGVAWVPDHQENGARSPPLSSSLAVVDAVREERAAGASAHGFAVADRDDFVTTRAILTVTVSTPGPLDLNTAGPGSLLEHGVLALLQGRGAQARPLLERARLLNGRTMNGLAIDQLIVLCGDRP